jgi:hypothetical protein
MQDGTYHVQLVFPVIGKYVILTTVNGENISNSSVNILVEASTYDLYFFYECATRLSLISKLLSGSGSFAYQWGRDCAGLSRLSPTMININDCKEIVKVASGKSHTCLLTDLGKVFTYGDKPKTGNDKPTLVPELQHLVFTNISCGAQAVFAVDKQGTVYTWGHQSAPEVVEHLKK